jgi:hypothetical protein
LWKDINFGGPKRMIVAGVPDLANDPRTTGFNDITSSITIQQVGKESVQDQSVTFFVDGLFGGRTLTLAPGAYPSLHECGWGDCISSIQFSNAPVQLGYTDPDSGQVVVLQPVPIAPLDPSLLWLKALKGDPLGAFGGDEFDIFVDTGSLGNEFGPDWNDSIRGIIPVNGTDFNGTAVVRIFADDGFGGASCDVGAGVYFEVSDGFGVSSIQILPQP